MRCQGSQQSMGCVFQGWTPGAGGGWSKHRWVASTPLSHLNLGRLALRPLAASTATAQLPVTQISDQASHQNPHLENWTGKLERLLLRWQKNVVWSDGYNLNSRSFFCVWLLRQFLLWGEVVVFLLSWVGSLLKYCISSFPQLIKSFKSENQALPGDWIIWSIDHNIMMYCCRCLY